MDLLQILTLAIVQGAAELLPVSSSAHVIVAEKLMGRGGRILPQHWVIYSSISSIESVSERVDF